MVTINLPTIGQAFFSNSESTNILALQTDATLNILNNFAILNPNLGSNVFGLHTLIPVGRDNVVRWGRFTGARYVARETVQACVWNPGGGITFTNESFNVCHKQHQEEICVDELMNSCWEKFLGIGVDITNISATAEGSRLLAKILELSYQTIGNDFYDMAYFANHPSITESDTNDYWMAGAEPNAKDWENYVAMQTSGACGGIMTLAESIKADGRNNFNLEIRREDVDGAQYIGDALAFIRRTIAAQPSMMKIWSKTSTTAGASARPVISVTSGIYQKLITELTQMYNGIPQGWMLQIQGEAGWGFMQGTIMIDGYWVLERLDWAGFDAITGMTSHIVMMTAPSVLGIATDVSPVQQFSGMGLVLTQYNTPPFLGKTYMHTNYKLATTILDNNYVVYGSLFLAPDVI